MSVAPNDSRPSSLHYRMLRDVVERMGESVPGKVEITKEGLVHDMMSPGRPHELTTVHLRRRLERVMPEELVAHTGEPDVEDASQSIMRRPDVMVIDLADMEGDGSFDARTLVAAIEVVSRSNPDNDWVGKVRDYAVIGVPVYAVFDPRTGTGAVLTDIHPTPDGPRYATRKDFVYGEDVTIAEWTISTEDLPRYGSEPGEQA